MDDLVTKILLGLVAVGFFSDLAKGFFQRKKINSESNLDDANAIQVIVGSSITMLTPLKTRIGELESETTILRNELRESRDEVVRTTRLLHAANDQLEASTAENKRVTAENKRLRIQLAGGKP